MSVQVIDKGYRRTVRSIDDLDGSSVTVGIHSDAGAHSEAEGLSVVQLGEIHEFGLGVPQRSWLRDYVDENERQIRKAMRTQSEKALKSGRTEPELDALGQAIVGAIQRRMAGGIGSPKRTLIDTGQLRQSITRKVNVK